MKILRVPIAVFAIYLVCCIVILSAAVFVAIESQDTGDPDHFITITKLSGLNAVIGIALWARYWMKESRPAEPAQSQFPAPPSESPAERQPVEGQSGFWPFPGLRQFLARSPARLLLIRSLLFVGFLIGVVVSMIQVVILRYTVAFEWTFLILAVVILTIALLRFHRSEIPSALNAEKVSREIASSKRRMMIAWVAGISVIFGYAMLFDWTLIPIAVLILIPVAIFLQWLMIFVNYWIIRKHLRQ